MAAGTERRAWVQCVASDVNTVWVYCVVIAGRGEGGQTRGL